MKVSLCALRSQLCLVWKWKSRLPTYFNLSKDGIPGKIISIHYVLAPDTHAPLASSFKDSGLRVYRETEVALGLMPP